MKNENRFGRLICLLLVLVLSVGSLSLLSSCKNDKQPTGGTTPGNATTDRNPDPDPETEEARYKPADKDFGEGTSNGYYDYKMLVTTNYFYQSTYVWDGEGSAREVCDLALFCRQNLMSERYNIQLSIINAGDKAYENLSVIGMGNPDYCQAAMLTGIDSISAAVNGYLLNLNSMPEFNLEASYWDQRIQKEYLINDYLFTLEGDFNYIDDLRTYVVIYNSTAYNNLEYQDKYGSPYALAAEGKWTYDMMMEMIADISSDVDGNDVMNERDFWGLVSETPAPYYFFLGSGMKFLTNESGTLKFDSAENASVWETNLSALQRLMSMGSNKDVLIADRDLDGDVWATASDIFQQNRALFRTTSLSATMRLLDMKDNYGIMPIPAYTADQDGYYCWVHSNAHFPLSIPKSVTDPSKAALAAEYLAYHSRYDGGDSLYYAFYDLLAYARLCRTPDDKSMLELVFANKTYDIDFAAKLTGIHDKTCEIVGQKNFTAVNSELSKIRNSVTETIRKFTVDVVTKVPNP